MAVALALTSEITKLNTGLLVLQIGEAKTAVKDSSEVHFDMNNLEKVQQRISYEEYCTRQKKAMDVKDKRSLKKVQKALLSLAHFQIIKQDFSSIVDKSILYLHNKGVLSKQNGQFLDKQSIKNIVKSQDKIGFVQFFNISMELLRGHIHREISSFQSSSQGTQQEIDIKLEVMSLFLKRYTQFLQYLPQSTLLFRNIDIFYELYSIKEVRKIKMYYKKFRNQLKYYESNINLNQAIDTYLILFLKRKYLSLQSQSKASKLILKKHTQIMQELKRNKQKALLKQSDEVDEQEKQFFTILFKQIKQGGIRFNRLPIQKVQEMVRIFQEFRLSQSEPTPNHEKVVYLYKEKRILYPSLIVEKYKRYKETLERLQVKYGKDLSTYKLGLMAYHLRKNSAYTYQQVMEKSFYGKHLYIQRQFFQQNIVRVLRKEAQYYQMAYLDKVMQGIEEEKDNGSPIIFVDFFEAGSQEKMREQMSGKMEEIPPETTYVSAVGFNGFFLCRMYQTKMSISIFLKEVTQMLQGQSQGATLVFFDRNFPSNWLKRDEIFKLRTSNFLLNVPFIEAIPNPSNRVCKQICKSVQQVSHPGGFQNQTFAIQQAANAYKGGNIQYLVDKQWEKAKKFNLSVEAKRLSPSELLEKNKKPEKQGPLDRRAGFSSLKAAKGKRKQANKQSVDAEESESESEAELINDCRWMSDAQQNQSESDLEQASPAQNPNGRPLPLMENIHKMNEEELRRFLPTISNLMPNIRKSKPNIKAKRIPIRIIRQG